MSTLYISYFGALKPLVQTQVIPYLRQLAEAGHEVSLVTFEEELPSAAEERKQRAEMRVRLERAGIRWYPLRYHKRPSLPATMFDVVVGTAVASYLVARHGIDVIHVRNHVPGVMGLVVKRVFGTKLLFDMRGVMAEEYVDAGIWREGGVPYRIVKNVERALFRNADAIVMLTNKIRDVLRDREPTLRASHAHVEVIPCCADLSSFATTDRHRMRAALGLEGHRVLVYAGSTGGWYQLTEMARFARSAMDRDPALHWLLLTQTPLAEIDRELRAAGLPSDRYTVKSVNPAAMPEHLAACDVAVSFIKPCFSKLSSSPTKIGEYLAAGLPIVTNRGIGDIDAMIERERAGVLIDEFSPRAYGDALVALDRLLADPGLAARCRAAAERHFSLERVGRAGYRRVYEYLEASP